MTMDSDNENVVLILVYSVLKELHHKNYFEIKDIIKNVYVFLLLSSRGTI